MAERVTAATIGSLLAQKHDGDVFVPECNLGSAHNGCRRIDAWVLRKTWSPVTAIGYEIKVSRNDFMRDEKWPAYLDVCHQLYFVCPWGLIGPSELPDGVGLMWTTKTGSRLHTKRKAPRREIELPSKLMAYVLMSRTQIVSDMWEADKPASRIEYWRRWAEGKEDGLRVARMVRRRIREEYQAAISEARKAQHEARRYEQVKKRMEELGFDPAEPASAWSTMDRLSELAGGIPNHLRADIQHSVRRLKEAQKTAEEFLGLLARLEGTKGAA